MRERLAAGEKMLWPACDELSRAEAASTGNYLCWYSELHFFNFDLTLKSLTLGCVYPENICINPI
jgi:hypothetical protein